MEYEPKFGRVLIEREIKDKTTGGIILPDAKRYASAKGKIIALGETAGWTDAPSGNGEINHIQTLKIGDNVIFGRYSGTWLDASYTDKGDVKDDGKLFICQDQDILAVIRE